MNLTGHSLHSTGYIQSHLWRQQRSRQYSRRASTMIGPVGRMWCLKRVSFGHGCWILVNPSVIFGFSWLTWGMFYKLLLNDRYFPLRSWWTSTGYSSNATGSFVTSGKSSPFIGNVLWGPPWCFETCKLYKSIKVVDAKSQHPTQNQHL